MELLQRNFTADADSDEHGHGTHCAGTVFGRDVDGVRIGVARGVTKALIGKVLGTEGGSSDLIVQAIQWAVAQGAHVISMSLGIDFPGVSALWAEKLTASGLVGAGVLESSLIAGATTTGMKPGFQPRDVGTGMAQAPRS